MRRLHNEYVVGLVGNESARIGLTLTHTNGWADARVATVDSSDVVAWSYEQNVLRHTESLIHVRDESGTCHSISFERLNVWFSFIIVFPRAVNFISRRMQGIRICNRNQVFFVRPKSIIYLCESWIRRWIVKLESIPLFDNLKINKRRRQCVFVYLNCIY